MTRFIVLTLFPEMIIGGLIHSMIQRASLSGLLTVECINIRDFSGNKHNRVDDYPYGGGAGMVMMAPPVCEAYESAANSIRANGGEPRLLYMSPQGKTFNHSMAKELASENDIVILCGRYEGIDERAIELLRPTEISLGDFILTGGEIAAMAIIDAVSRFIPGVLGCEASHEDESFSLGMLEYPQYTRPPEYKDLRVPAILLSGNHGEIAKWRQERAYERTALRRPELLS